MSAEEAARITLDDVSVCYRLAVSRAPSLKEYAIDLLHRRLKYNDLWALRDVSLSIAPGERVAIIGPNGAGKSTMLKVISGVLPPTQGRVTTNGWIAPILQLGTGFDFELTGVENIYLNALLLGRRRREIDDKLEAIVEFSGLGNFVYSPIRNYSTGMMARLGFAIATAWVPDVLILDEVLAVGDAEFVGRCEARLEEVQQAGATILLVSHALSSVTRICERGIWLDHGGVVQDGDAEEVVGSYLERTSGVAAKGDDGLTDTG